MSRRKSGARRATQDGGEVAAQVAEARRRYNSLARETQQHRTQAEVTRFFDGLGLLPPGVVPVPKWRPGSEFEAKAKSSMWGGVARR